MKSVLSSRCTEECNAFVQVKGSRPAQLRGVSSLSTGYYLTKHQGISFAAYPILGTFKERRKLK